MTGCFVYVHDVYDVYTLLVHLYKHRSTCTDIITRTFESTERFFDLRIGQITQVFQRGLSINISSLLQWINTHACVCKVCICECVCACVCMYVLIHASVPVFVSVSIPARTLLTHTYNLHILHAQHAHELISHT